MNNDVHLVQKALEKHPLLAMAVSKSTVTFDPVKKTALLTWPAAMATYRRCVENNARVVAEALHLQGWRLLIDTQQAETAVEQRSPKIGDDGELHCPGCGEPNLHHGTVYVCNRDAEDSATGVNVRVTGQEVKVVRTQGMNPSERRDGLRISFTCEHCPGNPTLLLKQHKGTTYLEWEGFGEIIS